MSRSTGNHSDIVLEMKQITKRFGELIANDRIDFEVRRGEIHALLGENGAGKTTLMKILYGLFSADDGEIRINGKPVRITSPRDAINLRIGMVHQHFMLIPAFTVAENIILGSEPARDRVFVDTREAAERVKRLSDQYGLRVDADARVSDITVGMQQRVEILKALYRDADLLILDEPTSVLTPQETAELGATLRELTNRGKSVVFITHKLREVMKFCDRVTVIRRGKKIGTLDTADTDPDQLASMMVGRAVSMTVSKSAASPGEEVLAVKNVYARDSRGVQALRGLSLSVRAGEVLGIAGVEGNGQSELVEVVAGLRRVDSGDITLRGKSIANMRPKDILSLGVSHVPEDRQRRGLILDFTVWENMILQSFDQPPHSKGLLLQPKQSKESCLSLAREFDVRPLDLEMPADSLSGGNQQRLILARELGRQPRLLIVSQPTRGLDVGAIEFVHQRIVQERDQGTAVLLISLDLDEILSLSDRIAVIFEGRIAGTVDPAFTTEEELGLMMTGGTTGRPKEVSNA
jgi:simple sugar transport system ATP-binding protein